MRALMSGSVARMWCIRIYSIYKGRRSLSFGQITSSLTMFNFLAKNGVPQY